MKDLGPRSVLFYSAGMITGGVATAFRALAAGLESRGYCIRLLLPYRSDIHEVDVPTRYIEGYVWRHKCRIRVVKRFLNLFNIVTHWFLYFLLVPRFKSDWFILYLPSPNTQWSRYRRRRSICWLHAMAPQAITSINNRVWTREIGSDLARFSHVVAVSGQVALNWKQRYDLSFIPQVMPNLINVLEIQEKSDVNQNEIVPADYPNILCVARLSSEKGIMRLLRVSSGLIREGHFFNLFFIGEGAMRTCCDAYIKENGLCGYIHMLGRKLNPYAYMKSADLVVLPSYEEGFGLTLVESLVCGTPVMATRCGGAVSALKNGRRGLLVENTENGIREGLLAYLKDNSIVQPACGFDIIRTEVRQENDLTLDSIVDLLERGM